MCEYTHENAWSRALGVGPFGPGTFRFVIADGRISQVEHQFAVEGFGDSAWNRFDAWLGANHPADRGTMYVVLGSYASFTPESIALWERHTAEFVGSLTAATSP